MEELFNGIILPNGNRIEYEIPIEKIKVMDITIRNHPAFNRKGAKMLIATEFISKGTYIGSYGGEIKNREEWNPYQLQPSPEHNYYIDGAIIGNEMKYINDPRGVGNKEANAMFYQSDGKIGGFYVCDIYTIRDIQANEEILVSYGDGYWDMLQEWYQKQNPHACPNCDYRTDNKVYLAQHLRIESYTEKQYKCHLCDKAYKQRHNLQTHISNTHKKKIYKCNLCNYTASNSRTYYQHKSSKHSSTKFECLICKTNFAHLKAYKYHMMAVHEKLKPFKCDHCEKSFADKNVLRKHVLAIHEKKKPFKCHHCDKDFSEKGNLKKHVLAVHEKKKPFKCNNCKKTFSTSSNLTAHVKRVHEKRRFDCRFCDSTYSDPRSLKRHIINFHEKKRESDSDINVFVKFKKSRIDNNED